MFKTFKDFARLAYRAFDFACVGDAEQAVLERLVLKGLRPIAVVCYINWADNEHLSYKQIGKELGITPQAVAWHLNRLRAVWPYLFNFGPKIPTFHHRRSSRGRTMGRLQCDIDESAEKF